MEYQQITPIYTPITAYLFLKGHKFFKNNNTKNENNSIPLHFVIKFNYFSIFVNFRGTLLVSINNGI